MPPDASSPWSLTEATRRALLQVFDFFGLKLLNIIVSKVSHLIQGGSCGVDCLPLFHFPLVCIGVLPACCRQMGAAM